MKSILYFEADHGSPTTEELQECINLKKVSDSNIVLKCYFLNERHEIKFTDAEKNLTGEECWKYFPALQHLKFYRDSFFGEDNK
jgi:hypothetical protein